MTSSRSWYVVALLLCGSLSFPLTARAVDAAATKAVQPPQSNASAGKIEPQIVRIRSLEGDVRVARGTKDATWEAAVPGLPIETGFSLVTGAGRAEIEFEDSSTVYLHENSVLAFNNLIAVDEAPITEVSLLTGTITMHVQPAAHGAFLLTTPTNRLVVRNPSKDYARVTSYLDGTAVTPQESMAQNTPSVSGKTVERLAKGQTVLDHEDGSATIAVASEDFSDWDRWVAARVKTRTKATAAMMQASGLTMPIPGLADLDGKGVFFACAPYGTCWEPSAQAAADVAARMRTAPQPGLTLASLSFPGNGHSEASMEMVAFSPALGQDLSGGLPGQVAPLGPEPGRWLEDFPCYPPGVRAGLLRIGGMGRDYTAGPPYDWTLCHAGSWIHRRNHYVWVAGPHKHHHCPVRWVKSGRTVGYVPLHPHDIPGKPPVNARSEVFTVTKKGGFAVVPVTLDPGAGLKVLDEPPREARADFHPPLVRVGDPAEEIHRVSDRIGKAPGAPVLGTRLTFDHHSQSFTVNKAAMAGSQNMAQLRSFNRSAGSLQSRPVGGSSGGAASVRSGGSSSGGSRSTASRASSSGASHASSSSGTSSSSASSGGGHH